MAGRIFSMNFQIVGALASSFRQSFTASNRLMRDLQTTSNRLSANLREVNNSYRSGALSVERYNSLSQRLNAQLIITRTRMSNLSRAMREHNEATQASQAARGSFMSTAAGSTAVAMPFANMAMTAANFEAIMSKVKAITGATGADFSALSNEARRLGATTKFSATQAGEAMTYLGMAGWKSKEIIAGMPGLLDLAAAGGTDLARTADIVSDTLTAMGLDASKSGHMADVFAVTITNTNTNVEMLGETMKYAAPVAHAFGASLEETSALAGLMANSGIKASQAGTALRSGFLRLAGPPKMASKAMEKLGMSMNDITAEQKEAAMALESLGISMKDTNGPKKMSAILTELKNKTADLGKEEKLAMLKMIFGTEAATGWLAVMDAGPEKFDAMVKALENSDGAAQRVAKTMNDNALGAITQMKSAIESASISIGNVFLPAIGSAALQVADIASGVAIWSEKYPRLTEAIIMTSGALMGGMLAIKMSSMAYSGLIAVKTGYHLLMQRELVLKALELKAKLMSALATRAQTSAMWSLTASMLASPWTWVILGIMGVVAVASYLYNNFRDVRQAWDEAWQNFKTSFPVVASIFEGIWEIISLPYKAVCKLINKVKELFGLKSSGGEYTEIGISTPDNPREDWNDPAPDIASNARGGIYPKGAFLTTFAEDSPEAAIPLDGSARAVSLWQQAGRELGIRVQPQSKSVGMQQSIQSPKFDQLETSLIPTQQLESKALISNTSPSQFIQPEMAMTINNKSLKAEELTSPNQTENVLVDYAVKGNIDIPKTNESASSITATFAPQIHITGNADPAVAQQIEQTLQESMADFERKINALQSQKTRVSYA